MEIYLDADTIRAVRLFLRWLGDPYLILWWKCIETYHWPRWMNARRKSGWAKCPDVIINLPVPRIHRKKGEGYFGRAPFIWWCAFREEMIEKLERESLIYVEVVYE